MSFQYITDPSSPIPGPALNGGLYTGELFAKDAGYANFPVMPCSAYWTFQNLRSANPPPQALYQMQNPYRPGNNSDPKIPGLETIHGDFKTFGPLNVSCTPTVCGKPKENIGSCGKGKRIISV